MSTTPIRIQTITLCVMGLLLGAGVSLWEAGVARSAGTAVTERMVLPDDRLVRGTVQEVGSGQIQVNIGELMPVVLSVKAASEKGMPSLQPGDKLTLVVSGENIVVDFHLADQPGNDRVLKGSLLQPIVGDQRWAVIRTTQGVNEPYEVVEGARQKMLNIPVGVPALYLLNTESLIIDATFGDEGALLQTLAKWSKDRQRRICPSPRETPIPRTGEGDHEPDGSALTQ
jgi:hypothetical protein